MTAEDFEKLGKMGGTWEQKASHLANINGALMAENQELRAQNDYLNRIYGNACVMRDHWKKKYESIVKQN